MMQIEDDVENILNEIGRMEWDVVERVRLALSDLLTQYYNDGYSHGMFDKEAELLS